MSKIPVGDTIKFAYSFVFGKFLTLLRLSCIPLVVILLPGIFTPINPVPIGASSSAPDHFPFGYGLIALFVTVGVVQLICIAAIIVAYTECALDLPRSQRIIYLPSASTLGKVIASWILAALVLVPAAALFVGFVAVSGWALRTSNGMERPGEGFVSMLVMLAGMGFLLYVTVRLTFLLTPTVVAEGKIDLRRSWDLTRGNFWRCMAIGISIMAPFVVVAWVLLFIFSKFVGAFPPALEAAQTAAQRQQALEAWQAEYAERMRALWPLLSAASIAFYVFMYGIAAGASAFAYRALVPVESSGEGDA